MRCRLPSTHSRTWRTTSPTARSNVLSAAARLLAARADDLAAEMVSEEGKPLADARNEASRTPKNLELYAGEAYRLFGATFPSDDTPLVYSVLDPVGVVAVITPWNFPLNLASRKIGPALAAGNAVVFKPSPMTPLMGARLADAFVEAGLPPGVLNVVHGFDAGAHLVADTRVDAVTFTGSTAVGHKIHAASRLGQRLQLELGGKNPVVVLADADIQAAADVVARSSFSLTGQACTGAGRILVEAAVYEELVEAVTERAAATSSEPATVTASRWVHSSTIGPSVRWTPPCRPPWTTAPRSSAGGARASGDGLDDGWFYPTTVLADARPDMEISRREVFGPVIGFERVDSLDEAIAAANDVEYGLSRGDLHAVTVGSPALRRRDPGRHGARQPADGGRRVQRSVRWDQAVRNGDAPGAARPDRDGLLHRQPHDLAGSLTWSRTDHSATPRHRHRARARRASAPS